MITYSKLAFSMQDIEPILLSILSMLGTEMWPGNDHLQQNDILRSKVTNRCAIRSLDEKQAWVEAMLAYVNKEYDERNRIVAVSQPGKNMQVHQALYRV